MSCCVPQEHSFLDERLAKWQEIHLRRQAERMAVEEIAITITLPDGSTRPGVAGKTTPMEIAKGISAGLAKKVLIAKVDDATWDLDRPLKADCKLQLLDFDTPEGKYTFWHSAAHVLGQALEIEENAHLCSGPPVEEGFYYDVWMGGKQVSESFLKLYEARAAEIIKANQPFERLELTKEEALELFSYNQFKCRIISSKIPDGAWCSAYRCGPLIDLCRGPHVPSTGRITTLAVTKNSSAYFLSNSDNESLQRVYGVAFPDSKQMKEYQFRMEEAAKRDHRRIGISQDLFRFNELSPGSAFFSPMGTRLYNTLIEFMRKQYRVRGYTEVTTPNIFNMQLWNISGHAQNYKQNMFVFEVEKQEYALKPMNCPGHCLMFSAQRRSYREMPLRFAEFGVLHRNEFSGALTGLTRVRRFVQDDAHIFCRSDQLEAEIAGCLDLINHVYSIFGFEYELFLSTRPENYLGEIATWDKAEAELTRALNSSGRAWKVNPGDGAFYGPKIDILLFDALKRKHQCATIQVDFQLPIRFDLSFATASSGGGTESTDRPVIVHRAVLGSLERMIAVLCEHTAGKWPFWLSPRQVCVVPVSEKFIDYANTVRDRIHGAGFFVDVDLTDNKLAKKIREAQLEQYNYILVVGEEERSTNTVNSRTRDNVVHGTKTLDEIIAEFKVMADTFQA